MKKSAAFPPNAALWSCCGDSNPKPDAYKATALPLSYNSIWQSQQDLNLYCQSQSLVCYRYTTGLNNVVCPTVKRLSALSGLCEMSYKDWCNCWDSNPRHPD